MDGERVLSTVVVVTWRGAGHITACLDALAAQTTPHRTIVVDNASDDGTGDLLARHPSRPEVLRLPRNTGYAGGIAAALPAVDTPFVAWLNDDAEPAPDWLATLQTALSAGAGTAAVGSRLERPDGTPQSLGVRLTRDGHGADLTGHAPGDATVFGFCGGAVLLRTATLRAVGGVPADFFCYYEDTDTAWRLRLAGAHVTVAPTAVVRHQHGASSSLGSSRFHLWNERNRLLMLLRCAPAPVAARELARFAALTAVLGSRALTTRVRRARTAALDRPPNFRVGLRCRVLAQLASRAPATLRARHRIGRAAVLGRAEVWRAARGE